MSTGIGQNPPVLKNEADMLRAYLHEREDAGADVYVLMWALSAVVGTMIAAKVDDARRDTLVDQACRTVRYNALLHSAAAGHG